MKIFHHNDLDGKLSAAIVALYYKSDNLMPKDFIELDYRDKVPIEVIQPNEKIYIVDFSFKPEVMDEITDYITKNIIWIDHHKTAEAYKYKLPPGGVLCFEPKKYAACELVWQWFFSLIDVPLAVTLVGDYDKWKLDFEPECFNFYEGLKMEYTHPLSEIWEKLLKNGHGNNLIKKICTNGEIAIKYRDSYCETLCENNGYEIELNGHKGFAANMYYFGSNGFAHRMCEYEFCAAYIHDGKQFTVSLYSNKIDVSTICRGFGGGGHTGAAGFVCKQLPWVV